MRSTVKHWIIGGVLVTMGACSSGSGAKTAPADSTTSSSAAGPKAEGWAALLAARKVDYSAALRTASLRLTGKLPSLSQINAVAGADDNKKKAAYESLVADAYLSPTNADLRDQLIWYWRNVFKMGLLDDATPQKSLDSAPLFAALLVLQDRNLTELFTATHGTCPTLVDGNIQPADCNNGVAVHAGILSNPDVMRHFVSTLAFRRVRWVNETFTCAELPVEHAEAQSVGGDLPYTSPWPFESIAGTQNGGRVDFLSTSSAICANCHATMNHIAPLFGNFDGQGMYQNSIQVVLPDNSVARFSDWLPADQGLAWRFGVAVNDLPGLGKAMAADRVVARCLVSRAWAWALGKPDLVTSKTSVPDEVINGLVDAFVAGGYNYRTLLKSIFTADDFVKF